MTDANMTRYRDNRNYGFWKTLKQEEVCLRAYETLGEARESIRRYVAFYHQLRPHRALKGQAPDAAYFGNPPIRQAA